MKYVPVQTAKTPLSAAPAGGSRWQDIITRSGPPVAKLLAVDEERPVFGIDEGRFLVPEDFDSPLDEDLLCPFEGRS